MVSAYLPQYVIILMCNLKYGNFFAEVEVTSVMFPGIQYSTVARLLWYCTEY